MGVSTDGILAFGVDLGDEFVSVLPWYGDTDDEDADDEVDFEDWYCKLHDDVSTDHLWAEYEEWASTPEAQAHPTWERIRTYEVAHPEWRDALNDLYAKKREIMLSCPIEPVYHCSGDYPMIIIAVKGTYTSASRGTAEKIASLDVDPERVMAAAEFCAKHDIPFDEPCWLLASHWG